MEVINVNHFCSFSTLWAIIHRKFRSRSSSNTTLPQIMKKIWSLGEATLIFCREREYVFFKKTWGEKLKNFWICIALYAPFLAHLSTPRVCSSPIIYIPPKKKKINTWDSSHPYKKRAFSFIQEYFILVLRVFLKVLYSIHLWLCWCCWLFCDIGSL